jgi:hypothetical protein
MPFHVYKVCFLCELLSGNPLAASVKTEEACRFAKDALPKFSLKRTTPQQIGRLNKLTPILVNLADFD